MPLKAFLTNSNLFIIIDDKAGCIYFKCNNVQHLVAASANAARLGFWHFAIYHILIKIL